MLSDEEKVAKICACCKEFRSDVLLMTGEEFCSEVQRMTGKELKQGTLSAYENGNASTLRNFLYYLEVTRSAKQRKILISKVLEVLTL